MVRRWTHLTPRGRTCEDERRPPLLQGAPRAEEREEIRVFEPEPAAVVRDRLLERGAAKELVERALAQVGHGAFARDLQDIQRVGISTGTSKALRALASRVARACGAGRERERTQLGNQAGVRP